MVSIITNWTMVALHPSSHLPDQLMKGNKLGRGCPQPFLPYLWSIDEGEKIRQGLPSTLPPISLINWSRGTNSAGVALHPSSHLPDQLMKGNKLGRGCPQPFLPYLWSIDEGEKIRQGLPSTLPPISLINWSRGTNSAGVALRPSSHLPDQLIKGKKFGRGCPPPFLPSTWSIDQRGTK